MYGSCEKIIKTLESKYTIIVVETYKPIGISPNFFDFIYDSINKPWNSISLQIYEASPYTYIGYINLIKEDFKEDFDDNLFISEIARESKSSRHKGAIKEVLYAIICIAIQLNMRIEFTAKSSFGNSFGRGRTFFQVLNPKKLYNYYNKIGFTSNNISNGNTRKYDTSTNNLKKILNKINNNTNNTTCFGRFCGRTRKRSRY